MRAEPDPAPAFAAGGAERGEVFARHPQSALPPERRAGFMGLSYFAFDPAGRVLADVEASERRRYDVASSGGATMAFERIGIARFALGGGGRAPQPFLALRPRGGPVFPLPPPAAGGRAHRAPPPPPPPAE